MRRLLASIAPVTLGLLVCLSASARAEGGKNPAHPDRAAGQQTIRGVIAVVTDVGETVVNYMTNGVEEEQSQTSYLTVVGSPVAGKAHHGEHGQAPGHHAAKAGQHAASKGQAGHRAAGHAAAPHPAGASANPKATNRPRENLYVLEITPETTFHEASAGGGGNANAPPTFEGLEVGDHVQVSFISRTTPAPRAGRPAAGTTGAKGRQASRKHGRGRIIHGVAISVTLLPTRHHQGQESTSGSHSPGAGDHHHE